MTRILFCLLLIVALADLPCAAQTPGDVLTVANQPIQLDTADGRKLLIVILPAQPDTTLTGQLIRFQKRHGRQVRILAIVAAGKGPLAAASPNGYGKLPAAGIILTEGIGDGAATAGPRSGLLQYLSRKSRHRQTDRFAEGSKYFLSEKGRLFAQLGRNGSLDGPQADYIVQTHVPGENRF